MPTIPYVNVRELPSLSLSQVNNSEIWRRREFAYLYKIRDIVPVQDKLNKTISGSFVYLPSYCIILQLYAI